MNRARVSIAVIQPGPVAVQVPSVNFNPVGINRQHGIGVERRGFHHSAVCKELNSPVESITSVMVMSVYKGNHVGELRDQVNHCSIVPEVMPVVIRKYRVMAKKDHRFGSFKAFRSVYAGSIRAGFLLIPPFHEYAFT